MIRAFRARINLNIYGANDIGRGKHSDFRENDYIDCIGKGYRFAETGSPCNSLFPQFPRHREDAFNSTVARFGRCGGAGMKHSLSCGVYSSLKY